jgi:hypothetical protein
VSSGIHCLNIPVFRGCQDVSSETYCLNIPVFRGVQVFQVGYIA